MWLIGILKQRQGQVPSRVRQPPTGSRKGLLRCPQYLLSYRVVGCCSGRVLVRVILQVMFFSRALSTRVGVFSTMTSNAIFTFRRRGCLVMPNTAFTTLKFNLVIMAILCIKHKTNEMLVSKENAFPAKIIW